MTVEMYNKVICGKEVAIKIEKTSNKEFPYYATCSYKGIDGAGKTVEEAKEKCENAVYADLKSN